MPLQTRVIPRPQAPQKPIASAIMNRISQIQQQKAKTQQQRQTEKMRAMAERKQAILEHRQKLEGQTFKAFRENKPSIAYGRQAALYEYDAMHTSDPEERAKLLRLADDMRKRSDSYRKKELEQEKTRTREVTKAEEGTKAQVEAQRPPLTAKDKGTYLPAGAGTREERKRLREEGAIPGKPVSGGVSQTVNVNDRRTEAVADRVAKEPELFQKAYEVVQKSEGENLAPLRQVLRNANYNRRLYNMMYPNKPPLKMLVIREPKKGIATGFMKKLGLTGAPEYPQIEEVPWERGQQRKQGKQDQGTARTPRNEPPPGFTVD